MLLFFSACDRLANASSPGDSGSAEPGWDGGTLLLRDTLVGEEMKDT